MREVCYYLFGSNPLYTTLWSESTGGRQGPEQHPAVSSVRPRLAPLGRWLRVKVTREGEHKESDQKSRSPRAPWGTLGTGLSAALTRETSSKLAPGGV